MKEVDFNIEDNWDFEEFYVMDLTSFLGRRYSSLSELVGRRIKLKEDTVFYRDLENCNSDGEREDGTIVGYYNDNNKIIRSHTYCITVQWDNIKNSNTYAIKHLDLI